jgi:hypothetical protein
METLILIQETKDRNISGDDRALYAMEICDYRDNAEAEYTRAQDACKKSENIVNGMLEAAKAVDTEKAWSNYDKAVEKVACCQESLRRIKGAQEVASSLCDIDKRQKYASNLLRRAKEHSDKAISEANKAEEHFIEMIRYKKELDEMGGDATVHTSASVQDSLVSRNNQSLVKRPNRQLQEKEICKYYKDIEAIEDQAKDICDESKDVVNDIKDVAKEMDGSGSGAKRAWNLYNDADKKLDQCKDKKDEIKGAMDIAKHLCKDAKDSPYSPKKLSQAESSYKIATSVAGEAQQNLNIMRGYLNELTGNGKQPMVAPTKVPTKAATDEPSVNPSDIHSVSPSSSPSASTATAQPVNNALPQGDDTAMPSSAPTAATDEPSLNPSDIPSISPSSSPSANRTTALPFNNAPPQGEYTAMPSFAPTAATDEPSVNPSDIPSIHPSSSPSASTATAQLVNNAPPQGDDTAMPSSAPSAAINEPSVNPSDIPSIHPSSSPSASRTTARPVNNAPLQGDDTAMPSSAPTAATDEPLVNPSDIPSIHPSSSSSASRTTAQPVNNSPPQGNDTAMPSSAPTAATDEPSVNPSDIPSIHPSSSPSASGTTAQPVNNAPPEGDYTTMPSSAPSAATDELSVNPSDIPSISPSSSSSASPTTAQPVNNAAPEGDYTAMPSLASSAGLDISLERSSEQEFLNRLTQNLVTSNTACEQVKQAMIQKTIAEETVAQGEKIYDQVMSLSLGLEGNADIEKIKREAEIAHLQVANEAAKACAAADLASQLCRASQNRALRGLTEEEEDLVQQEVQVATTAVVESRYALSQEKTSRDDIEEIVALIEFDPAMSELEAAIKEDEKILIEHQTAVKTEISLVDSQIQASPNTTTKVVPLELKKASLVKEEQQIEGALLNEEQFRISQSALKKDEYYSSVAPDFNVSPPLQYILRSNQIDNIVTVEKNWDEQDAKSGSKEEWFRRFGDMLVVDGRLGNETAFDFW